MGGWKTIVDFLPVAEADASWQLWLSSGPEGSLRPEDILIDTGRGATGDVRRYRVKDAVMVRLNAQEKDYDA
jgi:hypothetical protein